MDSRKVFIQRCGEWIKRVLGSDTTLQSAEQLTGGASAQTWLLKLISNGSNIEFILRKRINQQAKTTVLSMTQEMQVQELAHKAGVLVPQMIAQLTPEDHLGEGYLMQKMEGETLGKRIARTDDFAQARTHLARQCGEQLAKIHTIVPPDWATATSLHDILESNRAAYEEFGEYIPVFDYAFNRLMDEAKHIDLPLSVQHGDFRNGNLVVHPQQGLAAVLDWELFHTGPSLQDLGWLCINSWRFGNINNIVGGFGKVDDLLAAYNDLAGTHWSQEDLDFWIAWGSLRWGLICQRQARVHLDGSEASLEHAAIGRRVSETEMDLLDILL